MAGLGVSANFRRVAVQLRLRARVTGRTDACAIFAGIAYPAPGPAVGVSYPVSTEVTRAACVLPGSGGRCGCLGPRSFRLRRQRQRRAQAPAARPAAARRRSASWAPRPARTPSSASTSPTASSSPSSSTTHKSGVTQVKLIKYDTQGDPTQATNQAKKAVTDKVVGIVGPAFSGESKTAVPDPRGGRHPEHLAVGHQRRRWPRTAGSSGTACSPTTTCRARASPTSWPRPWARRPWPSSTTRASTARAWPTPSRKQLATDGVKVAVNDSINPDASSFSSTVNKVKPANVDAVFFGGYYSAAGKLRQAAAGRRRAGHVHVR